MTAMTIAEPSSVLRPYFMKSNFGALKNWRILNALPLFASDVCSITRRVTTIAVNIEMITPPVSMMAKPRTGPVPTE